MRLWETIKASFGASIPAPTPAASFSMDVPADLIGAMTSGGALEARVQRAEALQVPAVLRARNLIAGTLGSLPLVTIDPGRREVTSGAFLLGANIDPDIPNSVVIAQTVEDLVFEGISWWRVTAFGWNGYPVNARHVPHESVSVSGTAGLPSESQISPDQLFPVDGQVFIDGSPVADREVIRFDSPNPPLLRHAARAIRTALKLDRAAALYADDPLPLAVFTPKDPSVDPGDRATVTAMLDEWEQARSRRATGYVGAALNLETLGWSPEQLQLADARQHAVLEIARAAGIDPEDLGVSTTTRTYQNSEQRRQDLIDFTLGAYVSAIQDRLSMRDVLPRDHKAKIKFEGFLRSDTKTRMETYKIGREVGAYNDERIAELEDIPSARREPAPVATQPEDPQPEDPADMEATPAARFTDDPETPMLSFDDPEAYASFRVNEAKRTISGMVVPWGKVAMSGGARWRFAESSLRWTDASRIKLNLGHDREQSVGYAAALRNTSRGLDVTFKIAEVEEGDRALKLAAGKAWDGLSVEIDFEDDFGDDWQQDPNDRTTRLVAQAKLMHVALTPAPAFDDARVVAVAASKSLDAKEASDGRESRNQGDGRPREVRDRRVRLRRVHRTDR